MSGKYFTDEGAQRIIDNAVHMLELARSHTPPRPIDRKKSMEFSKKLMILTMIIFTGTWIVAVISWFMLETFPSELVAWVSGVTGFEVVFYMHKSKIENKAKIECGRKEVS